MDYVSNTGESSLNVSQAAGTSVPSRHTPSTADRRAPLSLELKRKPVCE